MEKQTSPASIAEVDEAVRLAENDLDAVLAAGGDSSAAWLAVHAAKARLQDAKTRRQEAAAETAAQARRAEHQTITDQVDRTHELFEQAVSAIEPVDGVEFDTPALPPAVATAVADLARAQVALTAAQPALSAANAARAAVADRIAPKVSRVAEIAARRADGDERDGDAAEVSLLQQDLARLNGKLVPLQAAVTEALAVVAQCRESINRFERALKAAEGKAQLSEMANRVRTLEAHFCAQIRALRLAAEARGSNNFASTFLPSKTLRDVANGGRI